MVKIAENKSSISSSIKKKKVVPTEYTKGKKKLSPKKIEDNLTAEQKEKIKMLYNEILIEQEQKYGTVYNSDKKKGKPKGVSIEDTKGKNNHSLKQIVENLSAEEKYELMNLHSKSLMERQRKVELEMMPYNIRKKEMEEEKLKLRLVVLGYVFIPMEGQLVDYYLRNKNLCNPMDLCPIEEADVYANHPQALTEKHPNQAEVWYFFTRSRPNETQACHDVQGQWVICEKKDVFNQGMKVGVKQLLEYCEGDHKSEYKIIEYQLSPAPENLTVLYKFCFYPFSYIGDLVLIVILTRVQNGHWFICKLYNGGCVDVKCLP